MVYDPAPIYTGALRGWRGRVSEAAAQGHFEELENSV
jgi:hypothetical protein